MALSERQTIQVGEILFDVDPTSEWVQVRLNKETTKIKRMDLWGMVFAISDQEQQDKMMPIRQTEMMTYERKHVVVAKRDIKKGDKINFRCTVNVPLTVVDGIQGMIEKKKKHLFL